MNSTRIKSYLYLWLGTLFLIYVIQSIISFGWFEYPFVDYRVWLSTGTILKKFNWFEIYNIALQAKIQSSLDTFGTNTLRQEFTVLPFAYPPLFSLLTFPFGVVSPKLEVLLTVIGSISFALWATTRLCKTLAIPNSTEMILGSVFGGGSLLSLFFFNPSILIMICCTCALTALAQKKERTAGVFFSLTIAKPLIAVWLIVGLCFSKSYRCLLSMLISSVLIVSISILFFGISTHTAWLSLLLHYQADFGTWTLSQPNMHMMWLRLESYSWNQHIIIATMLTVLLIFSLLLARIVRNCKSQPAAVLLACSMLCITITPHSQVHQTAVVTPFLIYYLGSINLSRSIWYLYLYVPIAALLLAKMIFLDLEYMHLINAVSVILCTVYILVHIGTKHIHGKSI